jgi:hypothetical protein
MFSRKHIPSSAVKFRSKSKIRKWRRGQIMKKTGNIFGIMVALIAILGIVLIASISIASGTTTIYMYYGNAEED